MKVPPYRTMLSHMMDGRDDSVVYYDDYVKADALLEFIEKVRPHFHVDVIHLLVGAAIVGLRENPKMNRFVAGKRLYDRNHKAITFSIKRKKLDREAKLGAVKLLIPDDESIESLFRRINDKMGIERSDAVTPVDKEINFMSKLPRPILNFCIWFARWADYYNLLPWGFVKGDSFFTSMFIANLGSLGMSAAYHHLYNYGNCPLFLMVGRIEDRPVAVDGKVVVQKTLHLRWSYDERIDDGLTSKYGMASVKNALEDPFRYFKLPAVEEPLAAQPVAAAQQPVAAQGAPTSSEAPAAAPQPPSA